MFYFGLMLDCLHGLRTQKIIGNLPVNFIWKKSSHLPNHSTTEEENGKWKQYAHSLPKHTYSPSHSANVAGSQSCPLYVMLLIILDALFKSLPVVLYNIFEIRQTRTTQNIQRHWQNTANPWHTDIFESVPRPFPTNLCHLVLFADYNWGLQLDDL